MSVLQLLLALSGCTDDASTDSGLGIESDADTDADADTDTDTDTDVPTPEVVSIVDIQQGAVPLDTLVEVSGTVTASVDDGYGIYVQEADGAYAGIWVYSGVDNAAPHDRGTAVTVIGFYEEYDGEGEWDDTLSEINVGGHAGYSSITPTGDGDVITPAVVTGASFGTADIEAYEGVLVTVEDVNVTVGQGEFATWEAGALTVDSSIYDDMPPVYTGDHFDSVTGVVHYGYGRYVLRPRDEADLTGRETAITPATDITPGDLAITELMVDPGAECDDTDDEYVELLNLGDDTVDLEGLLWTIGEHDDAIEARVLLAPGERAVLVRTQPSPCYGFDGDAELTVPLPQEGGDLTLARPDGTVLDVVDFTGWTIESGYALQTNDLGPDDNDDESVWCTASTALGSDFGTPGTAGSCF